jgi:phosphoribosylanthranilate isomerase
MNPKIKICGVNDAAFAAEAERLGADYIGVIFVEGSPRMVTPEKAREIVSVLSGRTSAVGVFGGEPAAEVARIARFAGVGIVQLHRRASSEDVAALRAEGFEVWALAGGAPADALLFDSSHGDGETSLRRGPWKTVLAGGVNAENVAEVMRSGADVVDASGSLETSPGVKSIAKLSEFMERVKACAGDRAEAACDRNLTIV